MGRAITATALAIALVAGIGSAAANTGRHLDPRDSSGALDIRVLRHGHGGDRLRHTIEMQGDWGPRDLHCSGNPCRGLLNVYFNTDDDDNTERIVQIFHRKGDLKAYLLKQWYDEDCETNPVAVVCRQGSKYMGNLRMWRSDADSISFALPVRKLKRSGKLHSYTWRAWISFRRDTACRGRSYEDTWRGDYTCHDYAPDYDALTHRL